LHRHHENIRLTAPNYIGQRRYFVTACSDRRHEAFASPETVTWLIDILRKKSNENKFAVEAYCVMPDHLHILIRGMDGFADARRLMKLFKLQTGYEYKKKVGRDLWQKKYYDHILRSGDSAEAVAGYIWQNPVRKGICRNPREYLFSGSFTLDWKALVFATECWEPPWKGRLLNEKPL
jgi:putative transposase